MNIEQNEGVIRLAVFGGVLVIMLALETLFPRKTRTQNRGIHIATNLGIVLLYTGIMRVLFPIAAMGTAVYAASEGWGLLNLVDMPLWVHILISAVLLDFAVYWQHVASHKVPVFWAFHKMHHADRDIDATTGIRFHPVEIILSMLYKMGIVFVLGPHVIGVFLFEIILNGSAMFNHANVRLPLWLDKTLRLAFVTPDMHRVHHSVNGKETNTNYGFNLSIWDKIFGSYTAQPKLGHEGMTIGLPEYQTDEPSNIIWCLKLPFIK